MNAWKPIRTRNGLTLWTFNLMTHSHDRNKTTGKRTFVAIHRDSDGARISPASWMTRRVLKGETPAVIAAFDKHATELAGRFATDLNVKHKCRQCESAARPYVAPLIDAISALLE